MPKTSKTKSMLLKSWISDNCDIKIIDDENVFCTICNKRIQCQKKFQIVQQLKTTAHQNRISKNSNEPRQQLLQGNFQNNSTGQETFAKDLCNFFLSCNTPLHKLEYPACQDFFKKYCKVEDKPIQLPSSYILRKKYVRETYVKIMGDIKNQVKDEYLWISVDETTDAKGGQIANLIIGPFNGSNASNKSYLISLNCLEKTNHVTIARFVNEALANFFLPDKVPFDKILLLVTDAASYMIKAATNPNLIHCSCLAHGLNRITEKVTIEFPIVNTLINNVKKVFLKAPLRIQVYKDMLPGIPLPPEPVLTRWGTWLNSAIFLAEHYEGIKNVSYVFDPTNCVAIEKCQKIFNNATATNQLSYIKSNFDIIAIGITKLEDTKLSLNESISIVNNIQDQISSLNGTIGTKIRNKLTEVLNRNEGFTLMQSINNLINNGCFEAVINIDPSLISNFKFAPITSCDVESSFSSYKQMLTDRRHNTTLENIEKLLIVYCNSKKLNIF